jgi:hypothetical protein
MKQTSALTRTIFIGTAFCLGWACCSAIGKSGESRISLSASATSTNVILSWRAKRGFVLETFEVAGSLPSWRPVTNNVGIRGEDFLASLDLPASASYYRLGQGFVPGLQVECIHYGFDPAAPNMTDDLRLSQRTGAHWWALGRPRHDPETGTALPYAYVDGYPEEIGRKRTAADAMLRWSEIFKGHGDSWTGRPGEIVGRPAIVLLDEITPGFKDDAQGPAFLEALKGYVHEHQGSRDDLFTFAVRSVSMTPSSHLYQSVVTGANNYLRFLGLELYTSQKAYVTGYEPDQPKVHRGVGDDYLVRRLLGPIHRWLEAGVSPNRLMVILTVSNFGGANGTTEKPFYKYLNRQFWMMANGWYTADRTIVNTNIQTVLRNGVGSYKFGPGTNLWQLNLAETDRDAYLEKYIHWYCVEGRTNAHPDGVDAH